MVFTFVLCGLDSLLGNCGEGTSDRGQGMHTGLCSFQSQGPVCIPCPLSDCVFQEIYVEVQEF